MASHLIVEEREVIAQMRREGKLETANRRPARSLDRITIPRKLRRNRSPNGYWVC